MNKKHFCAAVILLLFLAVGIQPTRAIDIPNDNPAIGTWTDATTYTLANDLSEGLVIVQSNFTLNGAGHTVTGPVIGVWLSDKTGVTIKNVTVSGFTWGIYFQSSNDNIVSGNIVSSNFMDGIGLYDGSSHNTINGNTIQNNYNGVAIAGQSNEVYNNEFNSNTRRQVYLLTGDNNQIYYNNFNGEGTMYQVYASGGANKIYNNNFIRGSAQYQAYVTVGGTNNVFNLPLPIGGNYWSDWTLTSVPQPIPPGPLSDDNGDGIVDDPRSYWIWIDPQNHVDIGYDYLPWVAPYGWDNYIPTPEQALLTLIDTVEELNTKEGIINSLDAKLQNALDALDAANAGQRQDAINKIEAFINAVEAQSGNQITEADADELIDYANYIIELI